MRRTSSPCSLFIYVPGPRAADNLGKIFSVDELHTLFEKKNPSMRAGALGQGADIDSFGFTGTNCDEVLTSDRAMSLARSNSRRDVNCSMQKKLGTILRELARARQARGAQADNELLERALGRAC